LVGLTLYTVADDGSHVALDGPIPVVNKKPAAKSDIQTTVQQILIAKPDIR